MKLLIATILLAALLSGCGSADYQYTLTCDGQVKALQVHAVWWDDSAYVFKFDRWDELSTYTPRLGELCEVTAEVVDL